MNQVYFKLTKKSSYYAEEEVVEIYGDEKLYTTPTFEDYQTISYEGCLSQTTNNQYRIRLVDTAHDSWDYTSWVSISGPYGNIVYKSNMVNDHEEYHPLSLYSPIATEQSWKFFQGSVAENWNQKDFVDSEWTELAYEADIPSPSATQFYRFSFTGLSSAAAYEVRFNYRHGIIAYINGLEIYRDNLPSGTIDATTSATGSYETYQYRGVLRNALEAVDASVLSVSIHLSESLSETNRTFDAWLAEYASNLNDQCYVVPYDVEISSSRSDASKSFDWDISDYMYIPNYPTTVFYHYTGNVIPTVNGVRIFPYTHYSQAPREYRLSGSTTDSSYTVLLHATEVIYSFYQYQTRTTATTPDPWRYYQLDVLSASGGIGYAYEMQLCVCNVQPVQSIEFPSSSYSFLATYESVLIKPSLTEITNCAISPELPSGLSLDSVTCEITGTAESAMENTTFTVTSPMNGGISGSFSLSFQSCTSTVLQLQRVYGASASLEAFTIRDAAGEVLFSVPTNHAYKDYEEVLSLVCVEAKQITLSTEGQTFWTATSYLYVHTLLDTTRRETLLRARLDALLGLPQPYTIGLDYPIRTGESWYYKMGEVPAGWDSAETSGWEQASASQFPSSTNRLQLYKRVFNVESLSSASFFTLNVKYRYGMIVNINGKEAFRYGVEGALSSESTATANYQEDEFHLVSIPVSNLLVEGSNRIAIALISITTSQTASIFDCSLRLIDKNERSRVWDYSAQGEGIYEVPDNAFNQYNGNVVRSGISLSSLTVTFAKNRRETINQVLIVNSLIATSYNPKSFMFQARNPENLEWDTLAVISDMTWSLMGQQKAIWIVNSKPYNQYRFYNILAHDSSWRITMLDLVAAGVDEEIPQLSYSPVTIYRKVEMAEVYPNSEFYTNFQITPELPPGISMDSMTGMISGTASETYSGTHQVTAVSIMGTNSSCSLEFTVTLCTNGRGLITLTVRTDYNPSDGSYALFMGRGESGSMISSKEGFGLSSTLLYFDFCLEDALYTVRIADKRGNGWIIPAGMMLSVDEGAFRFETEMIGTSTSGSKKLISFSSFLPFQNEFTEWKIFREPRNDAWTSVDLDDSAWESVKAGNIGNKGLITVYLRRTFALPSLEDYQVLNVLVKYKGGLVAYFNGHKVARFNLPETVDSSTEALELHDASLPMFFHVVLATVNPSETKNVFAVELHRVKETTTSEPIEFYATAVFGVNDCSIVRDSFVSTSFSELDSGSIDDLLDLSPLTSARYVNSGHPFFQWQSANLEGSRFNAYGFLSNNDASSWGFSLFGKLQSEEEDETLLQEATGVTLRSRTRAQFEVPVGLGGYQSFRWQVDALSNVAINMAEMFFLYCKASGVVCAAIDGFPSVSEGQLSPSTCDAGFTGYSYRLCQNGTFSEVHKERCTYKKPANVAYASNTLIFVKDVHAESAAPTYDNIVTEWYIAEGQSLPSGLALNPQNGVIYGTPTTLSELTTVRIFASNPKGVASAEVTLRIRVGQCPIDGPWPVTPVGETSVYNCATQGSYVGTQRRVCKLGTADGEWERATGMCVSLLVVGLLVLVGVLVVLFLVFILMRVTRRRKAVGGVKKQRKNVPKTETKTETKKKNVKV